MADDHTPGAVTYGQIVAHWINTHFLLLAAAVLVVAALYAAGKAKTGTVKRRKLAKTAKARNLSARIGPRVGWKDSKKCVRAPRKPGKTGALTTVTYAPNFTALDSQVAFIPEVLTSMYGGEWTPEHDHAHNKLKYRRAAPPAQMPEHVGYVDDPKDKRADVIPVAKDSRDQWIHADLTSRTPHVLLSGTTGFGKTSTLHVLIAHAAARGAVVDVIDPKRQGFIDEFGDNPAFRIHTQTPQMIAAIKQFRADIAAWYDSPRRIVDRIHLLVIDEAASFADDAIDEWHDSGGKGNTPAVFRDIKFILRQGRQAGFHVFTAAQQANVRALFGMSEVRDQYALRIAAGPQSTEAWRMLFGNEPRPDFDLSKRGRAIIGVGAEFTGGQLAYLPPADARRIAARSTAVHPRRNVVNVVKQPPENTAPEPPLPAETTKPTLTMLDGGARETTEKPRRGRPSDRTLVPLTCSRCGHTWETSAAEETSVKCPKRECRAAKRVPKGARVSMEVEA